MLLNTELAQIKRDIARFVGSKVTLESNKGRQKATVARGVIQKVYPGIFTVALDHQDAGRTVSYSYTDVLTRAVEITVFE